MAKQVPRWILLVIAIPLVCLGVFLLAGLGIIALVDATDRCATTVKWLQDIQSHGGIKVGVMVLVVGVVGLLIVVAFDLSKHLPGHWPFRKWAADASVPKAQPLAELQTNKDLTEGKPGATSTALQGSVPSATIGSGPIGIFRSMDVEFSWMPPAQQKIDLCCHVDFHGIAPLGFSPTKLRLTTPGEQEELGELEYHSDNSVGSIVSVKYVWTRTVAHLGLPGMQYYAQTQQHFAPTGAPTPTCVAIMQLEIRLPKDMESLLKHRKSGVKLDFEESGRAFRSLIIHSGPIPRNELPALSRKFTVWF